MISPINYLINDHLEKINTFSEIKATVRVKA
jgi:hypothetical protein